jgi:hypothetical protein
MSMYPTPRNKFVDVWAHHINVCLFKRNTTTTFCWRHYEIPELPNKRETSHIVRYRDGGVYRRLPNKRETSHIVRYRDGGVYRRLPNKRETSWIQSGVERRQCTGETYTTNYDRGHLFPCLNPKEIYFCMVNKVV